jgi:hypothetical protein
VPNTNPGPLNDAVLGGLREIQFMARRIALHVQLPAGTADDVNLATWLLNQVLAEHDFDPIRPDASASTSGEYVSLHTSPSVYTDGTPAGFEPAPADVERAGTTAEARMRWIVSVLHPLAHRYADGRGTYAPSMLNQVTRDLLAAGHDLSTTLTRGMSVWVLDGHGPGFDGLTAAERQQRHQAAAAPRDPSPF